MQLTEERKQQILASLKEDYVPFSDVFHEICADTVADILMVGALSTEEGKKDRKMISQLESAYFQFLPEKLDQIMPIIEDTLSLHDKYQKLRLAH